ncbi:exonuclease SbcCD subunit D C-terminal domain-containing protein [Salegentibacter sp. JZCK2]|uniref:exonuclease SbcCD subunit D C-terminal domain-containing protein n=1 Tax=Salegentibacter tibetensis TaxID=2873600 RepID=UPI001CCF46F3|nr:exonuclease SbcCD subunit D C-terminal domain-containing protein [Salegentibacter tibetensis]MBZ9731555.1 exonuclease SbcCD subunit D C-terminal domain-containing protein [Salegentibacter tibetensis]
MKILHTADWHIGKKLHKHSLHPDFDFFIDWLCNCIAKNKVEVLLVSGDVFDLANPSSEARQQYFKALMKLKRLDCKIILTGGNHDSPAMLNAPQEVLRELDIHIIGGLPDEISECVIPINNKENKTELLIAALPYLRDADLRTASQGNSYEDRLEALRKGIQQTFLDAAEICKTRYQDIPAIAMGHLFAAGAETSESERDIQIGNQAAFNALQFGDYFNYIALGHIHKPQRVNAAIPTFYSGSPIPLSFSERTNKNRILLLDTKIGWEPQSLEIPVFRKLLKITGNLDSLQQKLQELEPRSGLASLIEIELKEKNFDSNKIYELDQLVDNFKVEGYEIVKHRASFENKISGSGELYEEKQQLEDLQPLDVFQKLVDRQEEDEDTRQELLSAFNEILEDVHQSKRA